MRFSALFALWLSALMLALAPSMAAAAQPLATAAASDVQAHCNGTHNSAQDAHNGTQEQDKGSCLALCLTGHGGVVPLAPLAAENAVSTSEIQHALVTPAMLDRSTGIDPPPPRLA